MTGAILSSAGGRGRALAGALGVAAFVLAGLCGSALARRRAPVRTPPPALFYVGAAKADVTPTDLTNFYLGGYGIGPVHQATGVLRHIYFRVIAIRGRGGSQVVIGTLDSQGYSVAYQQGPYGFRDVENAIQAKLGIPASHIVLQATHSHNGPDEIGVWGGVPDAYLRFVTSQMTDAITTAVHQEQPARLRAGTADMTGYSGTFGSDTDSTHTGDNTDYPMDQQLRTLQAVSATGRVTATLVNYSTHATIYGPLNKVSPDWPGATATYLEGAETGMPAGVRYGYSGSVAIVTVGAMGHTWPAGIPVRDRQPALDPSPATDDNYPADAYGNAVARKALSALSGRRAFWLAQRRVGGTEQTVNVENTNPVLLAGINEPFNSTPLGGYKIYRANTPPWAYGDVFTTPVSALRVGDLAFFSVPGEAYPSLKFSLNHDVGARVSFVFGLAQDQLGYAEEVGDYNGAFQCSAGDEWFFTISPVFGSDVVRLQRGNAQALGFHVSGRPLTAYGPGAVPPSTNCTQQQLQKPGLPAG
jgi:hypothetical protein